MLASIAYLFVFPHLNIVIPFNCCNGVEPGRLELCPVRAVAAKFALPAMSAYCACPTRIALHGGVRWSGRSWRGRSMNKGGSEAWKKLRQLQQKLVSKSNSRACVAFVFSFSISPATFQSSAGTAGSNSPHVFIVIVLFYWFSIKFLSFRSYSLPLLSFILCKF